MLIQLIVNGIIAGAIYSLVALGFVLIYRTVRFFHFAHGAVYTAGAYSAYTFFIILKFNLVISFILAIILSSILGILMNRLVYYPLRLRKASNLILLIASFGIYVFLENLIALIFGNQILTIRKGPIKEGYHVLTAVITPIQLEIIFVSMLIFFTLWLFIKYSKMGKAMRAVADDPLAASVCGINPERVTMGAFGTGSLLAGVAGILISFETNIEPTMGFIPLLKGIIACIIGGIGSIPGAIFGGFFLGIAENIGIWKISAGWKDCISFAILIIFLLIRPTGFLGVKKMLRGE